MGNIKSVGMTKTSTSDETAVSSFDTSESEGVKALIVERRHGGFICVSVESTSLPEMRREDDAS